MKICYTCESELPLTEYYEYTLRGKTNHRRDCKSCSIEKQKQWHQNNKKSVYEVQRKRIEKDPEGYKELRKRHHKNYYDKHRKGNPEYIMSSGMWRAMRKCLSQKEREDRNYFRFLPYTKEELKEHLESQFEDWMTWDNWGKAYSRDKRTWNIDHKIPVSFFNYSSPTDEDFQRCWSLENLQPLEESENLRKHGKILEKYLYILTMPVNKVSITEKKRNPFFGN